MPARKYIPSYVGMLRMKAILELIKDESRASPDIVRAVKGSSYAVYDSLKMLRKTGHLHYEVIENHSNMPVVSYRINEKGAELLDVISKLETHLDEL